MRSVEARIYVSEHRAGDVNRLCETTLVLGLALRERRGPFGLEPGLEAAGLSSSRAPNPGNGAPPDAGIYPRKLLGVEAIVAGVDLLG